MRFFQVAASLLFLITLASCHKEPKSLSETPLSNNALLETLPPGTIGFYLFDYKQGDLRALQSAMKGAPSVGSLLLSHTGQNTSAASKGLTSLFAEFAKLSEGDTLQQQLFYVAYGAEQTIPSVGANMVTTGAEASMRVLSVLAKVASDNDAEVEKPDDHSLVIRFKPSNASTPQVEPLRTQKLSVLTKGSRVAVSSYEGFAKAFIDKSPPTDVWSSLQSSAEYKALTEIKPFSPTDYSLGFLSLENVRSRLLMLASMAGQNDSPHAGELETLVKSNLPKALLNVSAASKVDGGFSSITRVLFPDGALSALEGVDSNLSSLEQSPPNTIAALGLSGGIIHAAAAASSQAAAASGGLFQGGAIPLLEGVQSLSIFFPRSNQPSLFPGIMLAVGTADPAKLELKLHELVDQLAPVGQAPRSPWQDKEIAGSRVSYALSPLGIGAYIAPHNGMLLISTHEAPLSEILTSQSASEEAGLMGRFAAPEDAREVRDHGIFWLSFDFQAIAETVVQLEGSLSLFTGGAPLLSDDEKEVLRGLGRAGVFAYASDSILTMRSRFMLPEKKS